MCKQFFIIVFFSFFHFSVSLASTSITAIPNQSATNDKIDEIAFLKQRIEKYIKTDLIKAKQFGAELLTVVLKYGSKNEIRDTYAKLSEIEHLYGNYKKGIEFSQGSLEYSEGNGDQTFRSHTLNNIGLLYHQIGEYELALNYLQNSLMIKEKLYDSVGIAASYNNIGMLYSDINNYDQSLNYYFKSLDVKVKVDTIGNVSTTYNNIGTIYHTLTKYEKALEYYNKAIDVCKIHHNDLQIPNLLLNIGLLYRDLGDKDIALNYYEEALELAKMYGLKIDIAKGTVLKGSLFYDKEDFEKANQHYFKALDIYKEIGKVYSLASTYQNIGKTYYQLNKFDQAENFLNLSNEIAITYNLKSKISNNYNYLSLVYEARGSFDKALSAIRKHKVYADSVFNEESDKRLKSIQITHESMEKERELERFVQNEKIKNFEIAKRTNYIITLIVILICLSSLIFLIIHKNKLAKKTALIFNAQQTKISNQEKRDLELDLEMRNKELTTNVMNLIEKNELIQTTANALGKLKFNDPLNEEQKINDIIKTLKLNANKGLWDEFEKHFSEVHNQFYENLMAEFPALTPNERKLCAFLKLDMSTKDIATIILRSAHSINVARTRLRKKIGISNTDININTYLAKF